MAIKGLPFPTFAPPQGGGGITQVKMAPSQVRFPTARTGSGTYQPETIESVGGLLGFGADSLLKGLGGIFGQGEEEKNAEYLKSLADIENDDVREAQLQAYSIYGRPEDKDSFGLDEIANLVIASQMGSGSDEYIKGVLDSKKTTEASRLSTQAKRQTYINQLLKPVDRAKEKVFDPVSEKEVYVNYNKRSGKFEEIEGLDYGEDFDINLVRPTIDNGTYSNPVYYHLPTFNKGDIGEAIFTSKVNNKSGDVQIRLKDGTFLNPGDPGYSEYVPASVLNSAGESAGGFDKLFSKPQASSLVKSYEELMAKDESASVLMNLSNEFLDTIDKNIASGGKLNPLTVTSTGFAFINDMRNSFEVATKNIFGDQEVNVNDVFSKTADGGFREETRGRGLAAQRLHTEFRDLDNLLKDYKGNEKETNDYIRSSIDTWLDTADLNETERDSLRDTFRGMQADQMRMAAIQIQMAYTAAAVNGQTGRTLSDKDLAYHLQMIGFNGSNDLPIVKNTMLKFMDSTVAGVSVSAGSKFSKQAVASGVVDVETPEVLSMYKSFYNIPEDYLAYSDEFPNGRLLRGTDRENPYGVRDWTLKSMYERRLGDPVMQKYLGFRGERINSVNFYDRRVSNPQMYQGYKETPILNTTQGTSNRTQQALGTGFQAP